MREWVRSKVFQCSEVGEISKEDRNNSQEGRKETRRKDLEVQVKKMVQGGRSDNLWQMLSVSPVMWGLQTCLQHIQWGWLERLGRGTAELQRLISCIWPNRQGTSLMNTEQYPPLHGLHSPACPGLGLAMSLPHFIQMFAPRSPLTPTPTMLLPLLVAGGNHRQALENKSSSRWQKPRFPEWPHQGQLSTGLNISPRARETSSLVFSHSNFSVYSCGLDHHKHTPLHRRKVKPSLPWEFRGA
jgi:hypothetical protein